MIILMFAILIMAILFPGFMRFVFMLLMFGALYTCGTAIDSVQKNHETTSSTARSPFGDVGGEEHHVLTADDVAFPDLTHIHDRREWHRELATVRPLTQNQE